jgi:hypothetical protein
VKSTNLKHIDDTALVFEGGGMRGAFTAGIVATLIEEGIDFAHVSGISAGSSNTVNYVSRDAKRAHDTFTTVADSPEFGGFRHWIEGRGMFNVDYLYDEIAQPDGDAPLDLDTFLANPAEVRIGAFNATRGEEVWFTKDDMRTVEEVGRCVRASSTLPIIMPTVTIDGDTYVDGALGPNGGIPLDAPMRDGYRKFFVVLTRPRDFVKTPTKPGVCSALRLAFPRLPSIAEAVARRTVAYNAARRKLFQLEEQGRALIVTPGDLGIDKMEMNVDRLEDAYDAGVARARADLPRWEAFLGL